MVSVSLCVEKRCPRPSNLAAQLPEVVDLAVEHHPDGPILVGDRLAPGIEVDDAQAAHAQTHSGREVEAFVVGTPVDDGRAHVAQFLFEDGLAVQAHDASDSAHGGVLYPFP